MNTDMHVYEQNVLVLGIGNILWADEGFGVRCLEQLQARYVFDDSVQLVDGGTQGLYLTPYVNSARRLLILDAVDFGWPAGKVDVVRGKDVPSYMGAKKMSLHQTGFQEVLALASLVGPGPEEIVLIGCQPFELEDYGGSLSDVVKAAMPQALNLALSCLREWGVEANPRMQHGVEEAERVNSSAIDMQRYEAGRPSPENACRIGDERVLLLREQLMSLGQANQNNL